MAKEINERIGKTAKETEGGTKALGKGKKRDLEGIKLHAKRVPRKQSKT